MSESFPLATAWAAGLVLGAMYFGGLWWTVQRGMSSSTPARLFLGSFVIRMTAALGGFYLVGRGHWERLAICMVAFIVAREIVKGMTRSRAARLGVAVSEVLHEP